MRVRTSLIIIVLSILLPFLLFLSYSLIGEFTLSDYVIKDLPLSYSIESSILRMLGRNKLNPGLKSYIDDISSLSYVSKVDVKIKGTKIYISGELVEDALILTDGNSYYFYSNDFYPLSGKDVYTLRDEYIILKLSSSLLENFVFSSPTRDERKMIDTLKTIKPRSGLITTAEYDNNYSNIISGTLSFNLPQINSTLVFEDIREIDRLVEAVNVLENEYSLSKERLFCDNIEYVLSNGLLIKMR